jgi:nucleoside-diphosphate-sugar epimerase
MKASDVFVTGGTGSIGRALVRHLRTRGLTVTCLTRRSGGSTEPGVLYVQGDVTDHASVRRSIQGHRIVFHLAAHFELGVLCRDALRMELTNVEGTRTVLEEAWRAGAVKVVHCSSIGALGSSGAPGTVADERHPHDGRFQSAYVRTKHEGHRVARELADGGAPITIALPGAAYGPGVESILTRQIRSILAGRMIAAPGVSGIHSYTYIDDLVEGLCRASEAGTIGEEYILAGQPVQFADFCRTVARVAEVPPPRVWISPAILRLLSWIHAWAPGGKRLLGKWPLSREEVAMIADANWAVSSEKARRELGFQARTLSEGLPPTLRWIRGGASAVSIGALDAA